PAYGSAEMRITRVEATSHVVPVTVPLLTEPVRQRIVFVRVETDAGITGYGVTGGTQRSAVVGLVNGEAAALLVGTSPLETERRWQELFRGLNPRVQTGAWSTAMSAIDIAL